MTQGFLSRRVIDLLRQRGLMYQMTARPTKRLLIGCNVKVGFGHAVVLCLT